MLFFIYEKPTNFVTVTLQTSLASILHNTKMTAKDTTIMFSHKWYIPTNLSYSYRTLRSVTELSEPLRKCCRSVTGRYGTLRTRRGGVAEHYGTLRERYGTVAKRYRTLPNVTGALRSVAERYESVTGLRSRDSVDSIH